MRNNIVELSNQLKKEILENSKQIREILPNPTQLELIKFISKNGLTLINSAMNFICLSKGGTAAQLEKLVKQGWLEKVHVSGEIFGYQCTIK